jgi:hypothetical protein
VEPQVPHAHEGPSGVKIHREKFRNIVHSFV